MMKKNISGFGTSRKRNCRVIAMAVTALCNLGLGISLTGNSGIAQASVPFEPTSSCVEAPGGIHCINVRTWASNRNPEKSPTVIYLDGLRARWDKSGWEIMTNVQYMANHGVNVVEPVGGESSFYTDWNGPSVYNKQSYTYKWESFLTNNLPPYLDSLGFSRNYTLVGISMGGSAALTLCAHHPTIYKRAASLSGFLHLTAPGFADIMRVAMLSQNGYDLTAMWGPTDSPQWYQNDPYMLIPALRNTSIWISAGSGVPTEEDNAAGLVNTTNGVFIEMSARDSAKEFKQKTDALGLTKVRYNLPEAGVHQWWYWQHQSWDMLGTGFFTS